MTTYPTTKDIPAKITIIPRAEWGAVEPNPEAEIGYPMKPLNFPLVRISLNCTGSKVCHTRKECIKFLQLIQENYISCGFPDILHNFMIGGDGNVYEGRGWATMPDGLSGKNLDRTIDIAFIGWFIEVDPLPIQVERAQKLIDYGVEIRKIARNYKETWFRDENFQ